MTQTTFTDNVLIDGSQDTKQLRVQAHTAHTQPIQTWEDSNGTALAQVTGDGRLEILSRQDMEVLKVQGYTTQNQPLQTWRDSAGGVLAQVTGDGRVQVGDDVGLTSPDALIEAHRADTSTSKPKRGFHSLGRVSGALATLVQWIVQELELRGSSNIDALHTALRVRLSNLNTGTPQPNAELRGADIEVINDSAASASAVPKATGLQVAVTNASGKAIADAAALRLKVNDSGSGITNPYALFTDGAGIIHLEDFIELKVPAAGVPATPATNFLRFYPKSDGKLYAKNWSGTEFDLTGGVGGYFRQPCRVASASNINISTAPSSIDGVTLASGDRVLLTGQTTASQNGIWIFNGSGSAMTRPTDYAGGSATLAYTGVSYLITEGATYKGSIWRLTTTGAITIDTTSTAWALWDLSVLSQALIIGGKRGDFTHANTAARTYTLPDADGHVAFIENIFFFKPCIVVATSNVNIASAPSSIDGITLASGDRVLLIGQTTSSERGIWVFNGSGNAMTRPADYPSGGTFQARRDMIVLILAGLTGGGVFYRLVTSGTITIDTTGTIWTLVGYNGSAITFGTVGAAYLETMIGATDSTVGLKGAVPAPAQFDNSKHKVLHADATWDFPLFQRTRWNGFSVRAASSTVQAIGTAAPTLIAATNVESNETDGTWVDWTFTTSAALAGFKSTTFDLLRSGADIIYTVVMETGSVITNMRGWLGLTSAAITASDTLPGDGAAFRYSTAAGDPGWVGVVRNGTSQSVSGKVADIAASTKYRLRIRISNADGKIYFSVNDGAEVSLSSNLPRNTVNLGYQNSFNNTNGVAHHWKFTALDCYWPLTV